MKELHYLTNTLNLAIESRLLAWVVDVFVRCVDILILQSEVHRFEPDTKPLIFVFYLFVFKFSQNNNYKSNQ